MPLNIPGLLVPFQLLIHSRLVVPSLIVKGACCLAVPFPSQSSSRSAQKDIRCLDFLSLRKAGYRGVVFDKDNCLTVPHKDTLVPELETAWTECRRVFGENNIVVVSNSAGTPTDSGGIQSESVSHHLQVPVLSHKAFKPSYSCINTVRTYFSSLQRPISDDELIVVGDRLLTDIVMANRMRLTNPTRLAIPPPAPKSNGLIGEAFSCIFQKGGTVKTEMDGVRRYTVKPEFRERRFVPGRGPMAIWTTGIWEKEAMGMRWLEKKILESVKKGPIPQEGETKSSFIRGTKSEATRPNSLRATMLKFMRTYK